MAGQSLLRLTLMRFTPCGAAQKTANYWPLVRQGCDSYLTVPGNVPGDDRGIRRYIGAVQRVHQEGGLTGLAQTTPVICKQSAGIVFVVNIHQLAPAIYLVASSACTAHLLPTPRHVNSPGMQ